MDRLRSVRGLAAVGALVPVLAITLQRAEQPADFAIADRQLGSSTAGAGRGVDCSLVLGLQSGHIVSQRRDVDA
jgi:hypothetical protein